MEDMMNEDLAIHLLNETKSKSIKETLKILVEKFPSQVSFSTSFGVEDQVISDMIFSENLLVKVFTLDTGRLFEETYKVHSSTLAQYNKEIQVYHPKQEKVEQLLSSKGPFSFYESVNNRKECCHIRKIEPLSRALKGVKIWITGLRKSQSTTRNELSLFEYDSANKLIKYNPLINWSLEKVTDYIKSQHVPYNILHDKGFVSIGCAPCTRAIEPGQDFRAGRWWWENNSTKECGLHADSNDKE